MNAPKISLNVVRGVLTACKEQMCSVRINRTTGHGSIETAPEFWLRDSAGHEHLYQGELFRAAQPGHDIAVISDATNGSLVAVANLTTQRIHDGPELTIKTTPSASLISTLGFTLLLILPGLIPWFMLLDALGLGEDAFSSTGLQVYAVLLVVCVFRVIIIWSRRYEERAARTKAEIDRVLNFDAVAASTGKQRSE